MKQPDRETRTEGIDSGVDILDRDPYAQVQLPMGDPTAIRLLEILPDTSEDGSGKMSCELRLATLDGTYVALSYMWGHASENLPIWLNGAIVYVRKNLWDFLHQERLNQRQYGTRLLWVDALCIHQESILERNHQVTLMGQIYSGALSVLIWLGLETVELEQFFREMMYYQRRWGKLVPVGVIPSDLRRFEPFISHKYWSRAWILQECVLAKKLMLQCGSRLIPDEELDVLYPNLGFPSRIRYPFLQVMKARNTWRLGAGTSYLPLFDWTASLTVCSDPRDIIYSRISLADPSKTIIVDYNKTLVQLFEEIATHHIDWDTSRAEHLCYLACKLGFRPIWEFPGPDPIDPVVTAIIQEAKERLYPF